MWFAQFIPWPPPPAELPPFRSFIRLESIDPSRNRARFYALAWQPTLWGEEALRCTWGRLGTLGRSHVTVYADETQA